MPRCCALIVIRSHTFFGKMRTFFLQDDKNNAGRATLTGWPYTNAVSSDAI